MNYFTQLLESYTKLKKRTFKLEYITEEQTGAAAEASQKGLQFNPGRLGPHQGYYVGTGGDKWIPNESATALVPWEGEVGTGPGGVVGSTGPLQGEFPMPTHTQESPETQELAEKYLNTDIPFRLKKLESQFNKLCTQLELDNVQAKKDALIAKGGMAGKAASKNPVAALRPQAEINCLQKAYQQVYTNIGGGLGNLFHGKNVLTKDGDEINIIKEAAPGLIEAALINMERFFDAALNPEKEDPDKCKRLNTAVATTKQKHVRKKIIYGGSKNEGIIITGRSQFFNKAMEMIEKSNICPDAIEKDRIEEATPAGIAAKKGTMH